MVDRVSLRLLVRCGTQAHVGTARNAADRTEHRSIIPVSSRARIAGRNRVRTSLSTLEGSAEDSSQAL